MKLREIVKLTEGFFRNEIPMEKKEADKIAKYMKRKWMKTSVSWTMHEGDNHLFTYNSKTGMLMTDMTITKVKKMLSA